jgi:predicted short-subunit dehydrogenase-like oxidoreductase (DUF2520 family)
MKISIIGTGSLGKSLANHLFATFEVHCFGKREELWGNRKTLELESNLNQLNQFDLIFLAAQDQQIEIIVDQIKDYVFKKQWIVHGSGTISRDILLNLKAKTAVVHFLQTFFEETWREENPFSGISGTMIGDAEILTFFKELGLKHNMILLEVSEDQKKQIHIAAVFACNFQHAILDAANRVARIENPNAVEFLKPLVEKTMQVIQSHGVINSLSGPVKRGDIKTIEMHKKTLEAQPDLLHLYTVLADYLILRLKERGEWKG